MRVIKVQDVYNVTQISSHNNEPWVRLLKLVEQIDDEVMLDFEGIRLIEPWHNVLFRKLLGTKKVYLKLYMSEKEAKTIELMCRLSKEDLPTGRVINVEDEIPADAIPQVRDKSVDILKERISKGVKRVRGKVIIDLTVAVDQLGSVKTVQALQELVQELAKKERVKVFEVHVGDMFIQENIIEYLAKVIGEFLEKGIEFFVISDDDETMGKLGLYQQFAHTKNLTPEEKIKIIKSTITPYTVGMLSRFKETRKLDAFGRCGEGKPVECKVALYLGIDDNLRVYFYVFDVRTFNTRMQYALDHDGAELPGLTGKQVAIPINDLGFYTEFLGRLYSFNRPIQYSLDDYITVYELKEEGGFTSKKVTLPEYIRMVLNDHGVRYNEADLLQAIVMTKRYLEELKESMGKKDF